MAALHPEADARMVETVRGAVAASELGAWSAPSRSFSRPSGSRRSRRARRHGVTEAQLDEPTIDNPRRFLERS